MIIVKSINSLRSVLDSLASQQLNIGFVPTMGALHQGHISLIHTSKEATDFTVSSIFVNPTQFNNPTDLAKYPRTIEKDIKMLEAAGCDLLFLPDEAEIYPAGEHLKHYNLGRLDELLEGAHRPGHYQGVAVVVDKLLAIVQPDKIFMGLKDYQQIMVVKEMIKQESHKTEVVPCPTLREKDGLAMSSRNMRLNADQRVKATTIYKALQSIKSGIGQQSIFELEKNAAEMLTQAGFVIDYVSIADAHTLEPVTDIHQPEEKVALIAAWLDDIRLIDNLAL